MLKPTASFCCLAACMLAAKNTMGFSPLAVSNELTRYASTTPRRHGGLWMKLPTSVDPEEMELEKSELSKSSTQPTPIVFEKMRELLGESTNSSAGWVAAIALTMALMMSPDPAFAAMSGGRMGGSFSRSAPMMRSAPSRSYSGGSYYGGGRGGSAYMYSRPGVTIAPIITPPIIAPGFSPFYNPYYSGGAGVVSVNRGPGIFDLIFGFVLISTVVSALGSSLTNWVSNDAPSFVGAGGDSVSSALGPGTSVIQVSVALQVPDRDDPRSIVSVLRRLSKTARTNSRVGIQNLTSQVATELLRRQSSIVSGYARYKHFNKVDRAQRDYNQLAVKERAKFEQETVNNYGGVEYSESNQLGRSGATINGDKPTLAVVTLVLNLDGDSTRVPQIRSIQDILQALQMIASDVKVDDCLQSAEILWTPEDSAEALTLKDVIADYPELVSV